MGLRERPTRFHSRHPNDGDNLDSSAAKASGSIRDPGSQVALGTAVRVPTDGRRRRPLASLVGHLGLQQSRLPDPSHPPLPDQPHTGSYFMMISAGAGPGRMAIGRARKVSASHRNVSRNHDLAPRQSWASLPSPARQQAGVCTVLTREHTVPYWGGAPWTMRAHTHWWCPWRQHLSTSTNVLVGEMGRAFPPWARGPRTIAGLDLSAS